MNSTISFHKIDSITISPIREYDQSAQCAAFNFRELTIQTQDYDGNAITLSIELFTGGDPENLEIVEAQK